MKKEIIKRVYINENGAAAVQIKFRLIIMDKYKNGFTARLKGTSEETFIIVHPELNDNSGKLLFEIGDEIEVDVYKK